MRLARPGADQTTRGFLPYVAVKPAMAALVSAESATAWSAESIQRLPQPCGGGLRHDVADEGTHSRLRPGGVLELVLRPSGRGDLEHQPDVGPALVHRGLVPGGDVGGGGVIEPVQGAE